MSVIHGAGGRHEDFVLEGLDRECLAQPDHIGNGDRRLVVAAPRGCDRRDDETTRDCDDVSSEP
jgi:hypothetical protein